MRSQFCTIDVTSEMCYRLLDAEPFSLNAQSKANREGLSAQKKQSPESVDDQIGE